MSYLIQTNGKYKVCAKLNIENKKTWSAGFLLSTERSFAARVGRKGRTKFTSRTCVNIAPKNWISLHYNID